MKLLSTLLFILVSFIANALNYCEPLPTNGVNDYSIAGITLGSLNTSGGQITTYEFYPDTLNTNTTFLRPGLTYNLLFVSNNVHTANTFAFWIDWNNDTTLSSSEKLGEFTTSSPGQAGSISFSVPLNSITGKLRFRVRCSSSSSINSCANYSSGQTSDYSVTVLNNNLEYNFYAGWESASCGGNFINSVSIENIDNPNTGSQNGSVFSDYTRIKADVECCESEAISIETVAPNSAFNHSDVYVDINNDGAFTQNELVVALTSGLGTQTVSGSFSLPAITGERILRIYFYTNAGLSEVEDYTISLISSTLAARPEAHIGSELFSDCSNGCSFIGCEGLNSFSDLSCGIPSSWQWLVPGAIPSQSALQNPSFSFTPGTYTVTLIVSNSSGTDTDAVTIEIKQPFTSFSLGNDTSLCSGNNLVLNAPSAISPSGCFLYRWSTGAITDSIVISLPGIYWVRVDTCTHSACPAIDTIDISFSPLLYNVTGGGYYCSGASAPSVGLSDSQSGVSYQLLFNGTNSGNPVAGTGSSISFGIQNQSGVYTVRATNNSTGCNALMSGSVQVTMNALPQIFSVSGGGSFCTGNGGTITLSGSETGKSYELIRNGNQTGTTVNGTGSAVNFPLQYNSGNYTVVASDVNTSCTSTMTGIAVITLYPGPQQFNIIGGGIFCSGTPDASVGISGSDSGAIYVLYLDTIPTGDTLIGTGGAISFSNLTQSGEYTVVASMNTQCTVEMNGSANLNIKTSPLTFNVTGGGTYCYLGSFVDIGIDSSQYLVNYRLWTGGFPTGGIVPGTGSALTIASVMNPGTYNVVATNTTNGCSLTMNGVATITVDSFPHFFSVTGGGSFCEGDSGVVIGMDSSTSGVQYSLFHNGDSTGFSLTGTGSALNFGLVDSAGWYSVWATTPGNCSAQMLASATVSVNPLPVCSIVQPPMDTICIFQSPVQLFGSPSGGILSGNGITNNYLFPSVAGAGMVLIKYDFTDSFGCSSTAYDSIVVDMCIGIEENESEKWISVYPNPSDEIIFIEIGNKIQSGVIELYNSVSSLVRSVYLTDEKKSFIDISGLTEGFYFIRVKTGNMIFEKRLVVIH